MTTLQYIPAAWRELAEWNKGLVCYPREVKVVGFSDGNTIAYCEEELAKIETLLRKILK